MDTDIFSIPLERLTKINPDLNEQFFDNLVTQIPEFGMKKDNYWLINTHLTLENPHNLPFIKVFSIFVQMSRFKCKLIQITKN